MTINRGAIYPLLRPGVEAVIGNYNAFGDLYKAVFETHTSNKAMEFEDEFKSLGYAPEKAEGTSIAQDSMDVMFQKTYRHKTYGISFGITSEAMEDNLYQGQFPQQLISLRNSLRAAKNQDAANVFNLGNSTQLSIDGVPLYSDAHPLANGEVQSNKSAVALSEVGIENAIIQINQFKMLSGIPANIMAEILIVPPANQFAASIITNSQYRTSVGTVDNNAFAGVNDVNALYHDSYLPRGFTVNRFITSPTFSALGTNAERGFIHYERKKLTPYNWKDDTTGTMWFSANERYSFGASNWRCSYQIGA